MSIENTKNRDLFLKMCFMYFLIHILKVLGIDEEIEDILGTEQITLNGDEKIRLFDDLHDFRVVTKSGKIIIFEFKKNKLRKNDLKQVYDYYRRTYCREKRDVIAIIIVISKEGKITEYNELDITYHPKIIKTKKINKQKDLKRIRDKFDNNEELTAMECSLLIALPLFELMESEAEIVEEMCKFIKHKRHCIPDEELDGIIIGMYLNIVEYIDLEKQEELMELIDMEGRTKGVFEQWKEEQRKQGEKQGVKKGVKKGEKNIILELLKKYPIDVVSTMIHKSELEIHKILEID